MNHRFHAVAALFLAGTALAAPAIAQQADLVAKAQTPVRYGTWGVDISTRDLSVKPGDDFQKYASGKWLATNPIPASAMRTMGDQFP